MDTSSYAPPEELVELENEVIGRRGLERIFRRIRVKCVLKVCFELKIRICSENYDVLKMFF